MLIEGWRGGKTTKMMMVLMVTVVTGVGSTVLRNVYPAHPGTIPSHPIPSHPIYLDTFCHQSFH